MNYIALHNHSYYSLLDSTMAPAEIVEAAVQCGMKAVGLTDRDSLAGAVEFYKAAQVAGIHPVIGCEVTVDARGERRRLPEPLPPAHDAHRAPRRRDTRRSASVPARADLRI
jgi:DNA polymerase-3 subunit alpha